MTYERFLKMTMELKRQDELLDELYKKNVDLLDFIDPYRGVITELIKEVYGEEGYDWWSWFCYENDYGTKNWADKPLYQRNDKGELEIIEESGEPRWGATDENGNPICYDYESTWKFLENLRNERNTK